MEESPPVPPLLWLAVLVACALPPLWLAREPILCRALPYLYRSICVTLLRQRLRAGCVPIRIDPGGRLKLLLISSRKHPEWLTFPGGGVERGESLKNAASRESFEEAGLSGHLGLKVAEVCEGKARTVMYAMHVMSEHTEYNEASRERRWLDLGVPGSRQAEEAGKAARALLSPKLVHQRVLDAVLEKAGQLAEESERLEQASRQCGAPPSPLAPRWRGRLGNKR